MSIPIVALSMVAVIAVAVQTVNEYAEMVSVQRVVSEMSRRDAALLEECQNPVPEECVRAEVCLMSSAGSPVVKLTTSRSWNPAMWARWGDVKGIYLYELGNEDWAVFPWLPGTRPCAAG